MSFPPSLSICSIEPVQWTAFYGQKQPNSVYIDYAANRHPIRILHRAVPDHQHRSIQIHRVASCHKCTMNHHNHQQRSSRAVLLTINTVLFKLEKEREKKNPLRPTYRKTARGNWYKIVRHKRWGIWYKITHTLHYRHIHSQFTLNTWISFIYSTYCYISTAWNMNNENTIFQFPPQNHHTHTHTHTLFHTKWINLFFHQMKQRVETKRASSNMEIVSNWCNKSENFAQFPDYLPRLHGCNDDL